MASFVLNHIKCQFCGKMLFPAQKYLVTFTNQTFCNDICHGFYNRNIVPAELTSAFDPPCRPLSALINSELDPITLEVIEGTLSAACNEMGQTMMRTALSPIFYDGHDFTVGLFDAGNELIAQFEGAPAQLGAMKYALAWAIQEIGLENIEPGDVIVHNDSYRGTPHLPEFCLIMPIFIGTQRVAFSAIIAHHPDVGGKSPGSMPGDATDIFQEGVVIPPVKMFRRDEPVPEVWRIILANVRGGAQTEGDFLAMYGSLIVGKKRVLELVNRYGLDKFKTYAEESKNRSEYRMRKEIQAIPNGVYYGEGIVDDDGIAPGPFRIRTTVIVQDEAIIIDYRNTDKQTVGPVNAPYAVTVSGSINAISHLIDPTITHNEGVFRPIHFVIPPGTIVNVNYPAALNGGNTETHNIIAASVMFALAPALPERVAGSEGGTCTIMTGGGVDDSGNTFIWVVWEPVGWGGRVDKDGNSAMITYCGTTSTNMATEVLESAFPLMITKYELQQDSGGPGKFRGGLGVTREYELRCPQFELSIHSNRHDYPPEGIFEGLHGGASSFRFSRGEELLEAPAYLDQARSYTKASGIKLQRGQRIVVTSPGGGGYGSVKERNRDMIIEDLKNQYISINSAVKNYGLSHVEAEKIANEYWFERFTN